MTDTDPIALYIGTYTRRESFVDGKVKVSTFIDSIRPLGR